MIFKLIRLYFDVFDVDGNNYIDKKELKAVCTCIFPNDEETHWDDLFKSIDVNPEDGKIDYEEFKKWYEYVIRSSSQ